MSKCKECEKDMSKVDSCSKDFDTIMVKGKTLKRDTNYFDVNERCHDCNIVNKKGNLHHYGCDMERCPSCKGQLLGCECLDE